MSLGVSGGVDLANHCNFPIINYFLQHLSSKITAVIFIHNSKGV